MMNNKRTAVPLRKGFFEVSSNSLSGHSFFQGSYILESYIKVRWDVLNVGYLIRLNLTAFITFDPRDILLFFYLLKT